MMAAADALLLDEEQREFLGRLPVGTAICKMADHWMEPFVLRVPFMAVKNAVVSDRDVIQHMHALRATIPGCSGDSIPPLAQPGERGAIPAVSAAAQKGITEAERAFLVDVLKRPFAGMANRYRSLGVSTRNGNGIRHALEAKGLIAVRDVNTGKGQLKLPELTQKGATELQQAGYDTQSNGCVGGAEHHYWVHRVAEHFRRRGYQVELEKRLPSGGRVDIEAVKGAEKLAIEVETGKSDVRGNVAKLANLGYSRILLVPTNAEARVKCEELASGGGCSLIDAQGDAVPTRTSRLPGPGRDASTAY